MLAFYDFSKQSYVNSLTHKYMNESLHMILLQVKVISTVVATSTCTSVKPAISPSNVAQNTNPGTVLDSARPEDSKTPPTC